jgi:hypothetical protein
VADDSRPSVPAITTVVAAALGAVGLIVAAVIAAADDDQDQAETVQLLEVRCEPSTVEPGTR